MSRGERTRHHRKGESREHSVHRKYGLKKMATVVNHIEYERHHGYESAKRGGSELPSAGSVLV
jgi:hypothetical protein